MNPLELIRCVRLITDVCLEVAPGETVFCVADSEESRDILTLVAAQAALRGAQTAVAMIEPRRHHHHEPPEPVAAGMEKADIVVVMAHGGLVHTQARKRATAAGVKYALMSDMSKEYMIAFNLEPEDLRKVRSQTEELERRLTQADSAHLTTKAGTDVAMSLKGRTGVGLVPFAAKGTFFGVPGYAEAACPPIEDSAEGVLVVDGTMIGTEDLESPVEEPFEVRFKKGRIAGMSGGRAARRLESVLNSVEDQARTVAELGVNSNFMLPKKLWGTRMDMATGGHMHIGLGRNDHIGGPSRADTHLDLLFTYATLRLDGELIIEDGVLKI